MKMKKEYIVLGCVIVALAAYLLARDTDRTHYRLPALESVPAESLTRIEIIGPKATVELRKKGTGWVVSAEAYPADAGKIKQILDTVGQLTLTALVSESKSYDRYDLTEDKRITVKAWAGDTLKREFALGKAASSYKHTFVQIAGDHRVYHARESFRHTFDETVDALRDKTVLDFEIKDIREIRITRKGATEVFSRMESTPPAEAPAPAASGEDKRPEPPAETPSPWRRSTGEALDAAEVNRLLTTLKGLECDRYIYDRKKEALTDPVVTIELVGTATHTLSLFAAPEGADNNHPAVSSQNAYPFELTAYRAEEIMKALEKQPETPPEAGPAEKGAAPAATE